MAWTEQTAKRQLVKDQQIAKLGQVGKRVGGTSGRCTLAVDQETYIHTVQTNGGVHPGGKTIFDDNEFVTDMKRQHEHLRAPGEIVGPRRWGRTVNRTVYRNGVKYYFDYKAGTLTKTYPDKRVETIPLESYSE